MLPRCTRQQTVNQEEASLPPACAFPSPPQLTLLVCSASVWSVYLNNTGSRWGRKCLFLCLCSNSTIDFPSSVEPRSCGCHINESHTVYVPLLLCQALTALREEPFLFWMNSSVCWALASVCRNNTSQFPFLWTIQLPPSGRVMEKGLLDQCHHVCDVPRS